MFETVSPELTSLITACLDLPKPASTDKLNAVKLQKMLKWHRIRPQYLSYAHTNQLTFPGQDLLARESQEIAIINLFLSKEVLRISNAFQNNNILCYAYKGILWAQWLYGNFGNREAGDIDLLVAPSDFDRALNILRSDCGYAPDAYRIFLLNNEDTRRSFFATDYHVLLGREQDSTTVELHWQVAYPRLDFKLPPGEWAKYRQRYSILREDLNGFINEYQLLLLLVHHGGKEKWSSLKYIADFAAYMNRYGHVTDWGKVFKLAKDKGICTLLTWSLGILKGLGMEWKKEWPENIHAEDIGPFLKNWETMPKQPSNSTLPYLKQSLAVHDGLANKASVAIQHLKYLSHWKLIMHKARWYRNNA
ncbi:nucleotidyltransferase family protein [Dyadobacter sp. CY323]|uniref:nucleotidyltransferase family protein n=1 Tax=Dyadobacter sp. CY323 TaxID=2907302 RepID=UPI001F3956D9|nr:nucleotidyltransferase family protein [Dyadobacter sp. CY323]MCE6991608.1 nucleotidyltransferase family protein [Dyadobacter sp. CY323]